MSLRQKSGSIGRTASMMCACRRCRPVGARRWCSNRVRRRSTRGPTTSCATGPRWVKRSARVRSPCGRSFTTMGCAGRMHRRAYYADQGCLAVYPRWWRIGAVVIGHQTAVEELRVVLASIGPYDCAIDKAFHAHPDAPIFASFPRCRPNLYRACWQFWAGM